MPTVVRNARNCFRQLISSDFDPIPREAIQSYTARTTTTQNQTPIGLTFGAGTKIAISSITVCASAGITTQVRVLVSMGSAGTPTPTFSGREEVLFEQHDMVPGTMESRGSAGVFQIANNDDGSEVRWFISPAPTGGAISVTVNYYTFEV